MARTTRRPRRSWKKTLLWLIGIAAVLFVLIQFVPYGRTSHTNPSAANPFQWTNPKAEAIAKRSCYDCHSNKTKWWWATKIAPFSWLVQHDVDGGRARLNFSDFSGVPPLAYFKRSLTEGEMPQIQYALIHPNAKLTDAEKRTLINGYRTGLAASGGSSSGSQASATPSAAPTTASADAVEVVNSQCGTCHGAPVGYHAGSSAEAQARMTTWSSRARRSHRSRSRSSSSTSRSEDRAGRAAQPAPPGYLAPRGQRAASRSRRPRSRFRGAYPSSLSALALVAQ